jgi:hypothetical protein
MPKYRPGVKDETEEIKRALANPIGTRRLKGNCPGKKKCGHRGE